MTLKDDWETGDVFTAADANAVADRVNNTIAVADVKAYGAVGDGATDDTAAIVAAIAAAKSTGDYDIPVYFPPGIYLTDDIDWTGSNSSLIGAGLRHTWIRARTSSSTLLLDMTGDFAVSRHISGVTLDGNDFSDTVLDTSWDTYSSTTASSFDNVRIWGIAAAGVGWIAENNNYAEFRHCTTESSGELGARFLAAGGEMFFDSCAFFAPMELSAEIAVFQSCETRGIKIADEGKNILAFYGGYCYADPTTYINIEIGEGYRVENASFFGVLMQNGNAGGYMFGGTGVLAKTNIVGGEWFGYGADVTLVSDDVGSYDDITAIVDLDGVMLDRLDISDATRAVVRSRWCSDDGVYASTGGAVDYRGSGTVINAIVTDDETDALAAISVSGDNNSRFYIRADGRMYWGPGNASVDCQMYRAYPGFIQTDGIFNANVGLQVAGRPAGIKVPVPASASSTGAEGNWATDSSYLYICTATDTWVRGAVSFATW